MAPEALAHVLRPLASMFNHDDCPDLLVGLGVADDAAYVDTTKVWVMLTAAF